MTSQLIHFHNRPLVADRKGRVFPLEIILGVPKTLKVIFAASLALLLFVTTFSYGRTIWSHGVYFAETVSQYVRSPRVYAATGSGRTKSVSRPKPTRLPLSPDARQNAAVLLGSDLVAGESSAVLAITKLSVEAPVVVAGRTSASVNDALAKGVLFWPESAPFGSGGTTILLGHSSAPLSYRGKFGAVFSLLGKLEAGDMISIDTNDATYQYRVRDRLIINPKKEKPDLLQQDGEMLLLISCWPVGTNWQRVVVRAERVL